MRDAGELGRPGQERREKRVDAAERPVDYGNINATNHLMQSEDGPASRDFMAS